MKLFDYLRRQQKGYGAIAARNEQIASPTGGEKSSDVARTSYLSGGFFASDGTYREYPIIPFHRRFDYYFTVGKVQNIVDSYSTDITNRKWYFKDTTDGGAGGAYTKELKAMEHWGKHVVQVSNFFDETIINWTIGGVHIFSPKDFVPLQLRSIRAKIRDEQGNTQKYVQIINGKEKLLDASKFIEITYKNIDRLAWGVGLFDSLMNERWIDIDGRQPIAALDLHRQTIQDHGKIIHHQSNPLDIYMPAEGESVSPEIIDNDILPVITGAKPGDKLVINKRLEVIHNQTDPSARFKEYSEGIEAEIDAGLQSSKTRLITQPSAMADAKEAGEQDDDRILGVMERLKILMNKHVIPNVLGIDAGWIEFEWGEKDSFHPTLPPHIDRALELGIMTEEEARQKLQNEHDWTFPKLDEENQKRLDDRENKLVEQQQLTNDQMKDNDDAIQRKKEESVELEQRVSLLKQVDKQLKELR